MRSRQLAASLAVVALLSLAGNLSAPVFEALLASPFNAHLGFLGGGKPKETPAVESDADDPLGPNRSGDPANAFFTLAGPHDSSPALAELAKESGAPVRVIRDESGKVRELTGDGPRALDDRVKRTPRATAVAWLARHGHVFGLTSDSELRPEGKTTSSESGSVVRFRQVADGLPVLGGQVVVTLNPQGQVLSANAETTTEVDASGTATIAAARARTAAVAATARATRRSATDLVTNTPALWVYDPKLLSAPDPTPARPVWRIEVSQSGGAGVAQNRLVLVDATSGSIVLSVATSHAARDRRICDRNGLSIDLSAATQCLPGSSTKTRVEGASATGKPETDAAYDSLGAAYDLFAELGRDGLDNAGSPIAATVGVGTECFQTMCRPMDNAYFDSTTGQFVFGKDFAKATDVVAHEYTHGVTDATSKLFYAFESGAINESMSDVFGQLVQLRAAPGSDPTWNLGEDLATRSTPGLMSGPLRNMQNPGLFGQPDSMTSTNFYRDRYFADQGGVHINSGVGNKAAYLIAQGTDGAAFNGHTLTGIGLSKTARVYYATLLQLTEGSSYADLARVLPQACRDNIVPLVDGADLDPDALTEADCVQVDEAVAATRMAQRPATSPALPDMCDTGVTGVTAPTVRHVWSQNGLETRTGAETYSSGVDDGDYFGWYRTSDDDPSELPFSREGDHAGHAIEPYWGLAETTLNSYLTLPPVHVPTGASPYLSFSHLYALEAYPADEYLPAEAYGGGRVQVSTNGTTWVDAGDLIVKGRKYDTVVDPDAEGREKAFRAFGASSGGWVDSLLDVSSFAGKNLRVRFQLTTDRLIASLGWVVDDVKLFSCGTERSAAPTRVTVSGAANGTATVSWTRPDWLGSTPVVSWSVVARSTKADGTPGVTHSEAVPAETTSVEIPAAPAGETYAVSVYANNGSGAGAKTTGTAGATRTRLSAPVTVVKHGDSVTFTGELFRSSTGLPVGTVSSAPAALVTRPVGTTTWTVLTPKAFAATGRLSVKVTPTATMEYALRYLGGPGLRASTSNAVRVTVSQTVSSVYSATKVKYGASISITGAVRPAHAGQKVTLQRRTPVGWATVVTTTLADNSTYAFSIKPPKGVTMYRVLKYADADHALGVSTVREVTAS